MSRPDLQASSGSDFGEGAGDGFEAHRSHLLAVAYRMLGSRAEAEDAVQETWLRYAGARQVRAGQASRHEGGNDGPDPIRNLRAWLTTTTARICLDTLRSARVRREAYVGPWLPEPVVSRLPGSGVAAGTTLSGWLSGPDGSASGFAPDPAERAARTDQVSLALLVVLERLTAEQRVAFVLHDVFAVPFEEIAGVLGTSPAAARQLASRARRAVAAPDAPRHTADPAERRRVLSAFLAAAESGDLDALVAVLAPDAVAMGDGGGAVRGAGRRPIVGAAKIARLMLAAFGRVPAGTAEILIEPVLVNGELGLLFELTYTGGEKLRMVMGFAIAGGRVTGIFDQLNPAKLSSVPAADPARAWRRTG